ncbi:hypothetical protein BJ878DRAFT_272868 [Calycina marina]|uniref:DUF952 domain-containing protein n=1 Tax=Calycina marina TaxID=1763456 RepID=A0A9P7Z753_9HELO|nr:hypothetical protein BJ878DRAFT_272868 [Calycina marina]
MTEPSPRPKYIYKIVPASDPPPALLPEKLPVSALDDRDDFIHMSTSHQILGTLQSFFSSEIHIWILRVPYERVAEFTKWENAVGLQPDEKGGCWDVEGNAGYFPHIHGNGMKLGSAEVERVRKWERGEEWSAKSWPFDEDAPSV